MKFVKKLFIVLFVLGVIRLILPVAALAGFNYVLRNEIEDYTGQAKELELAILRGALTLKGLHLQARDKPSILTADVEAIKFNFSWQALVKKKIEFDIQINSLVVVITELPKIKPSQPDSLTFAQIRKKLAQSSWSSELNKFELRNSAVKFVFAKAEAPLFIESINADIFNMHFSPDKEWQLADYVVKGFLQGQGEIKLNGKIQPLASSPMVDVNFTLVDFDLKTLKSLLLQFLPLDLTKGKLSVYIEGASEKNFSNGYAKLFFDEVDVIENKQKFKSDRHLLIEFSSAMGNWFLKNSKEKSLAIRVPFKIKHNDVDVNTSAAFWSVFENNRNELDRKLESSISFSQNKDESFIQ